jgi:hypothetical protein
MINRMERSSKDLAGKKYRRLVVFDHGQVTMVQHIITLTGCRNYFLIRMKCRKVGDVVKSSCRGIRNQFCEIGSR